MEAEGEYQASDFAAGVYAGGSFAFGSVEHQESGSAAESFSAATTYQYESSGTLVNERSGISTSGVNGTFLYSASGSATYLAMGDAASCYALHQAGSFADGSFSLGSMALDAAATYNLGYSYESQDQANDRGNFSAWSQESGSGSDAGWWNVHEEGTYGNGSWSLSVYREQSLDVSVAESEGTWSQSDSGQSASGTISASAASTLSLYREGTLAGGSYSFASLTLAYHAEGSADTSESGHNPTFSAYSRSDHYSYEYSLEVAGSGSVGTYAQDSLETLSHSFNGTLSAGGSVNDSSLTTVGLSSSGTVSLSSGELSFEAVAVGIPVIPDLPPLIELPLPDTGDRGTGSVPSAMSGGSSDGSGEPSGQTSDDGGQSSGNQSSEGRHGHASGDAQSPNSHQSQGDGRTPVRSGGSASPAHIEAVAASAPGAPPATSPATPNVDRPTRSLRGSLREAWDRARRLAGRVITRPDLNNRPSNSGLAQRISSGFDDALKGPNWAQTDHTGGFASGGILHLRPKPFDGPDASQALEERMKRGGPIFLGSGPWYGNGNQTAAAAGYEAGRYIVWMNSAAAIAIIGGAVLGFPEGLIVAGYAGAAAGRAAQRDYEGALTTVLEGGRIIFGPRLANRLPRSVGRPGVLPNSGPFGHSNPLAQGRGYHKKGIANKNSNNARSWFGLYEIYIKDLLHKVGKADLGRKTKSSGLPTRLHQQLRKLRKKYGKNSVIGRVVVNLGRTTTRRAKAAETSRLQDIFDRTGAVPPGNRKSFFPKLGGSNTTS